MNVQTTGSCMDYNNNNGDPIMAATRLYHRKLLELTTTTAISSVSSSSQHHTNDDVAWNCAQHVLDQIWTAQTKNHDNGNDKGKAADDVGIQKCCYYYGCQTCGHLLHPGWNGTSLRVERSSAAAALTVQAKKTLRRRRQRQRKKLAISKLKSAKDVNCNNHRSTKHLQQKQANTEEETTSANGEEERIILLRDDSNLILERHHLAIRCGRCHSKVRLNSGLTKKRDKQKLQRNVEQPFVASRKQQQQPRHNEESLSAMQDTIDFVQLPPPPPAAAAKQQPLLSQQQQGRKKKKKRKPEPKTKLMNFLSSLND